MTRRRIELGKLGEDLACAELRRRGYAVIARRWRRRRGEIDIIARDGATLVFVEVKARNGRAFGDAAESVTVRKQRRIVGLARQYVTINRLTTSPCRFDVVTVHVESGSPVIELLQNAFDAGTA